MDDRSAGTFRSRIHADPIPHRWKIRGAGRFMAEPPADFRPPLDVAGDARQPARLLDDAGKPAIVALEVRDRFFKKRAPAKAFA